MAVICVVGCWYHVYIGYENTSGYETWLYAPIAMWLFNRTARIGRILKTGIRRATVTKISSTIVHVDVPGTRRSDQTPAVASTSISRLSTLSDRGKTTHSPLSPRHFSRGQKIANMSTWIASDPPKGYAVIARSTTTSAGHAYTNSGLTFFVRRSEGMTAVLKTHKHLPTLLEGPSPTNPTKEVLQSDRVVLIGGGIGITGLLPFLRCHPNVKLYYNLKAADEGLLESLSTVLDKLPEKDISVGKRLDINPLLREEASVGWLKVGVVVCGPAGMCDDVRAAVAHVGKDSAGRCLFTLEVQGFTL
ncbi:hypothetical protein F5Y14DRAFT_320230 [Nemania sp. NC0429]|nr:hypothetical protein F5Y14DRAFT_320230 [Nemania sp. NC0429]